MRALVLVAVICTVPNVARADDPTPLPTPANEILPLHRGQQSPRDGLLVDPDDMLHIEQEYQRLQFQMGLMQQRDTQVCDLRVHEQQAIAAAGTDRLALHESLWRQRQADLVSQVQSARHAAERGWWESPLLWFIVGAVTTSLVVVALIVAR